MTALEDKVAVVTGAAAGIGRAVVDRYVAEGARVVAFDRSDAVRDIEGPSVRGVVGDVTSWADCRRAVETAVGEWGSLDVFVGNAGIFDGARRLDEIDPEDLDGAFREIFSINVLGFLLGVRAAIDELRRAGGSVILTCSFASSHAAGGGVLYTASKHAALGVVRQLAYELAPEIRVNGVAPGVAPTRLGGISALGQKPTDSIMDGTEDVLPLHRIPSVDDYAGVYTLLASADARVMTGSLVTVDSGLDIRGM